MDKQPLLGQTPDQLKTVATEAGLPTIAAGQMAQWLYQKGVGEIEAMTNISKAGRERLAERYEVGLMPPVRRQCSADGTVKYLFPTQAGATVETVFIPEADKRFAIITYNDAQYLYSPVQKQYLLSDGSFASRLGSPVTFDDTHPDGDYTYMLSMQNANGETITFNNNGKIVINDWNTPDDGNRWKIEPVADFDPAEALTLAAKQTSKVTYQVTYDGRVVATATEEVTIGSTLPAVPATLKSSFVTLEPSGSLPTTVMQDVTVGYTATWNGPFAFSKTEADAHWYNMHIRSGFYVGKQDSEPYYPAKVDEDVLRTKEYQWAFGGDPYRVVVYNLSTGFGETLTKDGDNAVMRPGNYYWEIQPNADGFVLHVEGMPNNCVNQNGGEKGPLQFWNNVSSPTDNGSTFRVEEARDLETGIGAPDAQLQGTAQPVLYDLSGRRLSHPAQRGIYIRNRRKVTVR